MKKTVKTDKNRNKLGRFVIGNKANPTGNNGFMTVKKLEDALNNKAKQKGYEDFPAYVSERVFRNDAILIAVLKKIIPDRQTLEHDFPDKLLDKFRGLDNDALRNKAKELAIGIIGSSSRN